MIHIKDQVITAIKTKKIYHKMLRTFCFKRPVCCLDIRWENMLLAENFYYIYAYIYFKLMLLLLIFYKISSFCQEVCVCLMLESSSDIVYKHLLHLS